MTDETNEHGQAEATTPPAADNAPSHGKDGGGRQQRRPPKEAHRRDERRPGGHGPGGQRYEQREGTFPFELTTIRLSHGATVTAFDRSFDRYRNSFYHVTAVLQRLNLDDGIDLVQQYLETMVGEALSALREGKREVLAALEARTGSRQYKVMVPRPEEREARVPSFTCRQYLEVFRELDDFLNAVVYAESVGAISWRDRRTLFLNAPRHATSVAGRFQGVATRLSVHDLQQAASAFDALKAIIASSDLLPTLQEARSLALGQSSAAGEVGGAAEPTPHPTPAPTPSPVTTADAEPLPLAAEAGEAASRKRRKGNGQASPVPPAATAEGTGEAVL